MAVTTVQARTRQSKRHFTKTFAATQSAGAAWRAALQSLEVNRCNIINKAQSRTARALATVPRDPNVPGSSIHTKRDGKLHRISNWRLPTPQGALRRADVNIIAAQSIKTSQRSTTRHSCRRPPRQSRRGTPTTWLRTPRPTRWRSQPPARIWAD